MTVEELKDHYNENDNINYDVIILEVLNVFKKNKLRFYQAEHVLNLVQDQLFTFKIS